MSVRSLTSLMHRSNGLKQAVGILFVTSLVGSVLGLVRNIVIANRVGVTYGTIGPLDSYYAAFALPDLFYNFIIVGALSSAVVPLLVELDTKGDQEKFWRAFNTLISTGFVAITIAMVVLFAAMPFFVNAILPGFANADVAATTSLAKILLLSPLLFTVSQLISSALHAKRYFLASALSPLIYNIAIIAGAMLIPRFGLPALVLGVILGAVAHVLVQLPTLIGLGWKFRFQLSIVDAHVRRVIRLMIPRALSLTGNQMLLLAFYRIASHFEAGSIAIYRLTDDLQTAPVLLLANTLAMAVLPDFARHVSLGKDSEFRQLIGKALRLILFIFLPVTIFLLFSSGQVIDLYISVGHSIGSHELALATRTFQFFVVSLFFQGCILLLARVYFARGNTVRPTVISLFSIAVAWALALLLARQTDLGAAGLALAFSVGSTVNAVALWVSLKLPISLIWSDEEGRVNFPLVALGSIIFALVIRVTYLLSPTLSHSLTPKASAQNLVEIIFALSVGLAFYFVWSKVFKLEQWRIIHPNRAASIPK